MKLRKILIYTTVLSALITSTVFGATSTTHDNAQYLQYQSTPGTIVQFDRSLKIVDTRSVDFGGFTIENNYGNPYYHLPGQINVSWVSSVPGLIAGVNASGTQYLTDNGSANIQFSASEGGFGFDMWWCHFNQNVQGSVFITQTYQGISQTIEIKLINSDIKYMNQIILPSNTNLYR